MSDLRKKWFSLWFLTVLANQIVDCPSMPAVLLFHLSFHSLFSKRILYVLPAILNERTIFWSIASGCGWTWCAFKCSLINLLVTTVSSFWFNSRTKLLSLKPRSTEAWPWSEQIQFAWQLIVLGTCHELWCHQNKDYLVVEFSCWRCWIIHCWSLFL